MDFYVGTSRFYNVVDYFWYDEGQPGQAIGGAKIPQLIKEAMYILSVTGYEKRRDSIVYVGGGMPDITVKYKDRRYQEVVCVGEPADLVEDTISKMEAGARKILSAGAIPVFCTVTPMILASWNQSRLSKRKTSYLLHERDYGAMQQQHIDTVVMLNRRIDALNQQHHMQTPRLGGIVLQKRGTSGGYRLRENRLASDGCHLTEETDDRWIKLLRETADTNRRRFYANYDEDLSENDMMDISKDNINLDIDTLSDCSDISTTSSGRGLELLYNEKECFARMLLENIAKFDN